MKIFNSKKGLVWRDLIIPMIIGIMVLMLLLYSTNIFANKGKHTLTCYSADGVLADSCDKDVSDHLAIYDMSSKGKVCCVKKVIDGNEEKFNEWAKQFRDDTKELSGMSDGSSSSSGSSGAVPGLSRTPFLEVYNITIKPNSKPIKITHGTTVDFKTLNNYKDGNCFVTIQEAERRFNSFLPVTDSGIIRFPSSSKNGKNCPLGTKLDGSYKFLTKNGKQTSFYLLTYIITDKSNKKQELQAVLNVSSEDVVVGDLSHLQIKTIVSPTAPRSQNNHCFVTAYLEDHGKPTDSVLTFKINTVPEDARCSWRSNNYIKLDREYLYTTLSDTSKRCLSFADRLYTQITATATASTAGCNIIHIVPYSLYKKYFQTNCELHCEDYVGSNKISCYDYTARNKECQYTEQCNWFRESPIKRSCHSCDTSIVNCSSYTTRRACQENECLNQELCTWILGFPTGTCQTTGVVGGVLDIGI